ncbi:MAG: gamma-glutamylputrescine oxidase [Saprospiraceae bacterium]
MNSKSLLEEKLSWWEYQYLLKGVDYTILGAGIVGLSTAIELKQFAPELKVLIVDKKTYPIGASTKNAGFACFGSVSEILDDVERFGEDKCHKLIDMRWRGLSIMKERISASNMDYQNKPGVEIFDQEDEHYYHSQIPAVNEYIEQVLNEKDCFSLRKGPFGNETVNRLEGCLNPQKMMASLELVARMLGVVFLQGINVEKIDENSCVLSTNFGDIEFNKLVVCTNGFSNRLMGGIDVQPARNQVLITSPVDGFSLDGCYHMNKGFVYFREVNSRLILGGGRHLAMHTETTDILENTDQIINYLKDLAETKILIGKEVKIDRVWSGILGVGDDKLPIVKKINNNVMVAVRMGGMGIAIGSYIGRIAASICLENDNSDLLLYVRS